MEHLANDHEDRPNQHDNSYNLYDENGHRLFAFEGKSMKTEIITWPALPKGEKATM